MATQTGSIDMASMAEAAKTANDYITDVTSAGIQVHPKGDATSYAAIDANGMSVVRESESVAHFGESTRIGKAGESRMMLDFHSQRMIDRDGNEYFKVEDLRDESGTLEVTDTFDSDGESRVYVLTFTATDTDYTVTVSDGSGGTVTKEATRVTFDTYPTAGATITVTYMTASELAKSYTLGRRDATADVGAMSVAEGLDTAASGRQSHASGNLTTASGTNSYAGGARTTASGRNSRATGEDTTASGWGSHADGLHTIAGSNYQTAIGRWNDNDPNNAFEVGNGVTGARSNAFAVDWDGTVTAAGEVKGASVSASVTLASGVSATTRTVKRSGNVVTLYIDGLNLAAELANHGTAVVATVPSGYRPAYAAYAQLSGWNNGGSYVTVGTNGSVTVSNQSGAAIPTARELGFTVSYVM